MNFIEKIKDIRTAKENNKLVIFVGAGVSKNSKIPTWEELIEVFAKKLNYDKCKDCKFKDKLLCSDECKEKYNFAQDEFLKIPQYFYNQDASNKHEEYKKIIKDSLDVDVESNLINDIIFRLLPSNIITTNYDRLLENTPNHNVRLYEAICKDEDLLNKNSNRYIIKMHGDIKDLDNIVLKENDYISYSQNHILIETKIKSLLIDHTFLFVGYSLNDYNLKLIMGWIEHFAKEKNIKDRPKNYIIQISNEKLEEYVEIYLNNNNILVLNTSDIPEQIKEKHANIKLSKFGQDVYGCLDYILDSNNDYCVEPLVDILLRKFSIFKEFKRISYEDLSKIYSFENAELKFDILYFHDEKCFEKLKDIINSNGCKEVQLKKILNSAGIKKIQYSDEVVVDIKIDNKPGIDAKIFDLYLNNRYDEIIKIIDLIEDKNLKFYYNYLIKFTPYEYKENEEKLREIEEQILNNKSIYELLIYKCNKMALNQWNYKKKEIEWEEIENIIDYMNNNEKMAYGFMKKIISDSSSNLRKQYKWLEDVERNYINENKQCYLGCNYSRLPDLYAMAYDYYFYYKSNNVAMDYFSNPREYFEPYLKSILCTYNPNKNDKNALLGGGTKLLEYTINEIDLDMFVKFTNSKELKEWIKKYKVNELKIDENINIIERFQNFCNSLKNSKNIYMFNQLYSFVIILSKIRLESSEKANIIKCMYELVERYKDEYTGRVTELFEPIYYICRKFDDEVIIGRERLLYILLDNAIITSANQKICIDELENIIKLLSKYCDRVVSKKMDILVNEQKKVKDKLQILYMCRKFLNDNQKQLYEEFLIKNSDYVQLFWFIFDNVINIDNTVIGKFVEVIDREAKNNVNKSKFLGMESILQDAIGKCIVLSLINKIDNILFLEPYKEYSIFLKFIFNPENFDYSLVDFNHYMWLNLIKNDEYREIILKNRKDIDASKIKSKFENGTATKIEERLLYRYLLEEKEFWNKVKK